MNKENNMFETQDLYLASFLKARGLKLLRVVNNGCMAIFYFECKDNMDKVVTSFYSDRELVNANRLIGSIRDLKSLVHNIQKR